MTRIHGRGFYIVNLLVLIKEIANMLGSWLSLANRIEAQQVLAALEDKGLDSLSDPELNDLLLACHKSGQPQRAFEIASKMHRQNLSTANTIRLAWEHWARGEFYDGLEILKAIPNDVSLESSVLRALLISGTGNCDLALEMLKNLPRELQEGSVVDFGFIKVYLKCCNLEMLWRKCRAALQREYIPWFLFEAVLLVGLQTNDADLLDECIAKAIPESDSTLLLASRLHSAVIQKQDADARMYAEQLMSYAELGGIEAFYLAFYLRLVGMLGEAKAYFVNSMRELSDVGPHCAYLADIEDRLGLYASAIEFGERAVALRPGSIIARRALLRSYMRVGQLRKAWAVRKELSRLERTDGQEPG